MNYLNKRTSSSCWPSVQKAAKEKKPQTKKENKTKKKEETKEEEGEDSDCIELGKNKPVIDCIRIK